MQCRPAHSACGSAASTAKSPAAAKPEHEASSKLAASGQPAQPLSKHYAPDVTLCTQPAQSAPAQHGPAQSASAQRASTQHAFAQRAQHPKHVPEPAPGEPVLSPQHSGSGHDSKAEDGQGGGISEQGCASVMSAAMPWHMQGLGQADQALPPQAGVAPQEGHLTAQRSYAALHAMQTSGQPWLSEAQHGLLPGTQHSRPDADAHMHRHAASQHMWVDQSLHTPAEGRYSDAIPTSSADGFVWQPVHPRDRQSISLTAPARASAELLQQASMHHSQTAAERKAGLAHQSHRWQQGERHMQGLADVQTSSQAPLQGRAGLMRQAALGGSSSWHNLQTAYAAAQASNTDAADLYEPYAADHSAAGRYALQTGTAAVTHRRTQPARPAPHAAGQQMPASAPQGADTTSRYAPVHAADSVSDTTHDSGYALQHDSQQQLGATLWTAAKNRGPTHQPFLDSLQEAAVHRQSSVLELQAGTAPLQDPEQDCQVCIMHCIHMSAVPKLTAVK